MKKTVRLIGTFALAALIALSFASCKDDGDGSGSKSVTLETTVDGSGVLQIQHNGGDPITATVTTNLPSPNDASFTLASTKSKNFTGLVANSNVTVKITVSTGLIMNTSVNPGYVWFSTHYR